MNANLIGSAIGATAFVLSGKQMAKSFNVSAISPNFASKVMPIVLVAAIGAAVGYVLVDVFADTKNAIAKKSWS